MGALFVLTSVFCGWGISATFMQLVLVFEELIKNLRRLLPTIAQFIGIGERYASG